jgi:catechol-2,3-dioxygenase
LSTLVAQPTLTVTDLGRAQRFYTKILGFRLTDRASGQVGLSAPHLSCDLVLEAAAPGGEPPARESQGPLRMPVATLAALAEACDRLARSGARIMIIERPQRLSVHTTDPDGHALELFTATDPKVAPPPRPRALTLDGLRTHG